LEKKKRVETSMAVGERARSRFIVHASRRNSARAGKESFPAREGIHALFGF
jgi:hypothetical protein